ncbi:DUF1080 domain-containing protein [Halosquirtibacter xylanolyticus]|uniref:3-keto-disaccharide hydrolase n=1 Tax=Halosquirtibacter xylanolyticus TaxID=3374599 RepID=UPI0037486765|nr:DUF1080 domain-containing protein [Prolixibacteraceae bacterium]
MKNNLLFLILLLCFTSCAKKQTLNHLTKQEQKQGWELLFDGKTTNGWRTYGKDDISGWKVIDGVLYNSGKGSDHGGDIITMKEYDNFELYIEWRIDSKSNSGIFYHVNDKVENAIYKTAPEYQLLDDKGWPTKLNASQYTGANYAMNPPTGAEVRPLHEFNNSRIIVNGPHVEHWLNGVKVVDYELWSESWEQNVKDCKWSKYPNYGRFKKGHIGLQDHGGSTRFRNIKIRRL